ncbi:uncharacterized protein LOC123223489 [Mangifera indica]|uniref:uncharacterized protein LOC123223489 n=1 Tax=Mangifera indica TaxID=29780 RepID=UPI001CFA66CE|nr:uncharacterized protein LOC123223489 [Mangifera indica]
MTLVRLSSILRNIDSHLALGNVPAVRSFSTPTEKQSSRNSRWKGSMHALYRRISAIGNPRVSIVPILDQWVEKGRPVDKEQLLIFIKELRSYRRFRHALDISMWMTDKRYLPLTHGDVAIRLDLISKVHGTEQAENYFNNVPEKLKGLPVYSALLNCYVHAKSVEKAEATMQKMRDLGLARATLEYNILLNLYYHTANYEKLDSLMHEMQEKGIRYNKYTLGIRLSAFGAATDIEGIDKTLAMMESDPDFVWDWTVYSNAASGYAKAGSVDKAVEMLKKSEELIIGEKSNRAYEFLITLYAKFGKKDDVLRLWELYKVNHKIYNSGYRYVIPSVLKFDDFESAQKIFDEWELVNENYDIRILNFMIAAHCRKGLLQEAETLIDRAKLKGGKPNQRTWFCMAIGYVKNNQTQKAVEAMEEALVVRQTGWKPGKEIFAACVKYFKGKGDIEGAEKFIKSLRNKDIITVELQDRLLSYVQSGKSNSDGLSYFSGDSLNENGESHSEPDDDISESKIKEIPSSGTLSQKSLLVVKFRKMGQKSQECRMSSIYTNTTNDPEVFNSYNERLEFKKGRRTETLNPHKFLRCLLSQMTLVRLSTILRNIDCHFALGNVPAVRSVSITTEKRSSGNSRWRGSMHALYRRISPVGNPRVSIVPILDQWVEEGRPVKKEQLLIFIKELRSYRRFRHALEISMWMTDKRYLPLTPGDVAIRLDLISKVHGTEEAENYFSSVPEQLKGLPVYSSLLNCYVSAKSVEKAEATMQKMRDLGLAQASLEYNSLLNLYYHTANYEKLDSLMHEMQEKGIRYNKFTLGIRLSAFGATSDVEGIDKTLAMMESDPDFVWDWTVYSNAASGYAKAGLMDKAVEMLKKSEELITGEKSNRAYEFLITLYAKFGKKDDVLRLWELYKKNHKIYNKGYICVIPSVLKFDDFESAQMIFDAWESVNENYDIRILNFMIGAYSRKGLLQEAKTLIDRAKLKGGRPNQKTWLSMAVGYFKHNQTQKAVEAMEEALVVCQTGWKPRKEIFAACLKYFKGKGDIEGAEKFIKLLRNKDIILVELQDKLLNYVQNGKSNLDELSDFSGDSLNENGESHSEPEDDISESKIEEIA